MKGPLTRQECIDPTVVRERFEDVLDRFFLFENSYAVTGAWNALEWEVLRPLLETIKELQLGERTNDR